MAASSIQLLILCLFCLDPGTCAPFVLFYFFLIEFFGSFPHLLGPSIAFTEKPPSSSSLFLLLARPEPWLQDSGAGPAPSALAASSAPGGPHENGSLPGATQAEGTGTGTTSAGGNGPGAGLAPVPVPSQLASCTPRSQWEPTSAMGNSNRRILIDVFGTDKEQHRPLLTCSARRHIHFMLLEAFYVGLGKAILSSFLMQVLNQPLRVKMQRGLKLKGLRSFLTTVAFSYLSKAHFWT